MGLKLLAVDEDLGGLDATYLMTHSSEAFKTTLTLNVHVRISPEGAISAGMEIDGPAAHTPDEALDRLAEWLERSAEAIRRRPTQFVTRLPVFPE